jgi:protein-S-isoprenylcysteine O-methyltransferase Ste14
LDLYRYTPRGFSKHIFVCKYLLLGNVVMSPKEKRPIPLIDVVFGSIGSPLIGNGIFYAFDSFLFHSPTLITYPLNLSGIVFIILGVSLASWCFRVVFALPKEPILVTWGPWGLVRHPIYLAGFLLNLGTAILIGTMLLSLEIIVYTLIDPLYWAPHEEQNLRKSFPDEYEKYSKRVPRWIPRTKRNRSIEG